MTGFSLANMVSAAMPILYLKSFAFLNSRTGLRSRQIHDQMLRSKLSRIPRRGPHP